MILIDNIIVSDEIIQEYFCCHLEVCHGLCCVSGKGGAALTASDLSAEACLPKPWHRQVLTKVEVEVYENNYREISDFLTKEGVKTVESQGVCERSGSSSFATPLLESGECAYAVNENGAIFCGLERAAAKGNSLIHRPISCLLYPIRIAERPPFEILRFNHWDVCHDARAYGREKNIRLYQFVKEGLIRRFGRFGEEFYRRLSELAEKRNKEND
ncbi:MAG: DUF3109 family protein [Candidatus Omnitrophica bacterium]|nr:DUF3109 family protein [Candidatus Omnitrophota bacterium]